MKKLQLVLPLDVGYKNFLKEIIDFTLIGGNKGTMSREEILIHIINHTTYHRGFLADMFLKI